MLTGQDGPSNGHNEGTAMMEIVYDMAPGSTPIFATAFTGEPQFAQNIIDLQAAGCKVIADDVTYSDEGVFQDTIIAQAVNQVVASGSTYFSSAANSGSALFGNSEAYEGDFKDGGPVSGVIGQYEGGIGNFHDFGGQVYDSILNPSGYIILQWSDPYGGACNDYDLFVTNSAGTTLKGVSAAIQDCSAGSIPDEETTINNPSTGDKVYVVLYSGAARALHVNGWGSALSIATTGNTYGHNAGMNTVSMAATYFGSAHLGVVPFTGMANPVEPFSSDGPRKIFYTPAGVEITPGNCAVRHQRRHHSAETRHHGGGWRLHQDAGLPAVLRHFGGVPARSRHRGPRSPGPPELYAGSGEKGHDGLGFGQHGCRS